MNRLAQESSPYLKHAAEQHVDWYPWSEASFEAARHEDKPVFVSSGAVWCHWCHVMSRESFDDVTTAGLMNGLFINIKLDRDERPDVDLRLQQAVAAMGGETGWPLSIFLTPEKEPFFGGTYFPAEPRQGRPGFRQVLQAVSSFYRQKKTDARSFGASVAAALTPDPLKPKSLNQNMLDQAERNMLSNFDGLNGGFGNAPKFPMPGAIEFLMRRFLSGSPRAGQAAKKTLAAMARGGFHDHLAGGFHRYSVDEAWMVPHFEKMTGDNAELLKSYAEAFLVFGDEEFGRTAEETAQFIQSELSAPDGGFYASQDADVPPADEGGFFTWTNAEIREVLKHDEYEVLSRHLLHERAHLHDPSKKVLSINQEPRQIAAERGLSLDTVERHIANAKKALAARRRMRTPPFVDKTIYTSLNGMMIASYFRASIALDAPGLAQFAKESLGRVLRDRFDGKRLHHSPGVQAQLDDYIRLIDALVTGYEALGQRSLLDTADELMELCKETFWDPEEGGFFDSETEVLGVRLKRIEDVPQPSANAVGIMVLLKLAFMTEKEEYRGDAEKALTLFAAQALAMGVHAGAYFSALHAYFHWSTLLIEAEPDGTLARQARSAALRSCFGISYGANNNRVIACFNGVCAEPASDIPSLSALFCNRS